jgi:hypothetical protein
VCADSTGLVHYIVHRRPLIDNLQKYKLICRGIHGLGFSMRVNVYSQELTSEVVLINKKSNTGLTYSAVQIILHSSNKLHHPPLDDDRSAVTFWLPKSAERRTEFAETLRKMAEMVEKAPKETGLD